MTWRDELQGLRMERSDSGSLLPWCVGALALVIILLIVLL